MPVDEVKQCVEKPVMIYGKNASAMILSRNSVLGCKTSRDRGLTQNEGSIIRRSLRNLSRLSEFNQPQLTASSSIERKRYANY